MRRGFLTFEAAVVLLLGAMVAVASVALLGQVLAAVRQVRLPALEAFEAEVWRLCSVTPPGGVEVGPSGVTFRYLTAYRGGEAREAVLSLSGSELVLSENGSSRVVARGVTEALFSVSGGLLRVSLRGEGWAWERDFMLLRSGGGDGSVLPGGSEEDSPAPPPPSGGGGGNEFLRVLQAAAGGCHSLALLSDGRVTAWGGNGFGQLGDGTTANRYIPAFVKASAGSGLEFLQNVVQVAAGAGHSLAVLSDGRVVAWGGEWLRPAREWNHCGPVRAGVR